ncbi:MAG: type pilus assembly protein PilB [Frankiaceae bacterium]|nr:type pilus assembly protein PilB [Frankiaceae bacterium]
MPLIPPSQRNRQPLLTREAIEDALAGGIDPLLVAAALENRENAPRRRRIGEVLVQRRTITQEQLDDCLADQARTQPGDLRPRLGSIIVEKHYATDTQVAEALAAALILDLVDLSRTTISPDTARLLPREMAERNCLLVLAKDGRRVTVAAGDPTNVVALDDVRFHTGASTMHVVVATESQIRDQLRRVWSLTQSTEVASLFEAAAEVASAPDSDITGAETAPIVRLVDMVFRDAAAAGASDIHIESQAKDLRIRFRVDGVLRDVMTMPKSAAPAVISRIKVVSGLDIAERRRPQDGRTRVQVDGRTLDARVSTLPALHGEKVVIRLLSRGEDVPTIDRLGLADRELALLRHALNNPQGLVLITGPTGSGKTNTLYGAIQDVATPERNVITLEDPIEVQFPGITQVQMHEKAGMTFAAGLRSVLRQDPDVVLVGEARDRETAELAVQASMTGHLVLTTLHTNDTVKAITRLVDMGLEPFLLASALTLVVAQRLVRKPCPMCVAPYTPDETVLTQLGLTADDLLGKSPRRGRGCSACANSGYSGRRGVFEMLPITAELRTVMLESPTESAIAAAARDGGLRTLRMNALDLAHRGDTTYDEVLRVTQVDAVSGGGTHCRACTRPIDDGMAFCPWCGAGIDKHSCASCATPLLAAWTHCPTCGAGSTQFVAPHAPGSVALEIPNGRLTDPYAD